MSDLAAGYEYDVDPSGTITVVPASQLPRFYRFKTNWRAQRKADNILGGFTTQISDGDIFQFDETEPHK